ncbi:hypothetical protein [Janthinobacterium svalbardensis]|uniref:hypothetical protein n=1 Tax=Janthinobacterium svalbardensis TaxID=368607 RepID=UPI0012FE1F37|nr:hypothetical protein [Janthinobacterium svalbardensis]
MEFSEIRSWIQFLFIIAGGVLGMMAFFQNMRQRALENALKMTKWFHDSIVKEDISSWADLFHNASESAGAPRGSYISDVYGPRPLSDYFSEGSPDSGAVGRISDCLNVICHEIVEGGVDPKFIWFEFGQLLRTIHMWLGTIKEVSETESLLESAYPSIDKVFSKYGKKFNAWPSRTYAYLK